MFCNAILNFHPINHRQRLELLGRTACSPTAQRVNSFKRSLADTAIESDVKSTLPMAQFIPSTCATKTDKPLKAAQPISSKQCCEQCDKKSSLRSPSEPIFSYARLIGNTDECFHSKDSSVYAIPNLQFFMADKVPCVVSGILRFKKHLKKLHPSEICELKGPYTWKTERIVDLMQCVFEKWLTAIPSRALGKNKKYEKLLDFLLSFAVEEMHTSRLLISLHVNVGCSLPKTSRK